MSKNFKQGTRVNVDITNVVTGLGTIVGIASEGAPLLGINKI